MTKMNDHFANSAPICPRVQRLIASGKPVHPLAVHRDHPQAHNPSVRDFDGVYRPRCHCDDGGLLLEGGEREAYLISVAAAEASENRTASKHFPSLGICVVVNLNAPDRWVIHKDGIMPAGGRVYPIGRPAEHSPDLPQTLDMPQRLRYRHIEEHHHHYAPPEHIHHGQPAAQNVTLGGVLLKLFGGR